MPEAHEIMAETLISSFQEWGWLKGLQARGPETLFITDADILDLLAKPLSNSKVRTATKDAFAVADMAGVQEVIFFCRRGEWALANKARSAHPDVIVSAATYDYLPASIISGGFERIAAVEKAEKAKKTYNAIITAPGSGVEDLIALMQGNKLEIPRSFLSGSLFVWVNGQPDFAPLRYLSRLGDYLHARKIDLVVTTEELDQFLDISGLAWRRAFMTAAKLRLNLLYFTRRAKVLQAVELAFARGLPDGSKSAQSSKVDTAAVDSWIHYLLALETTLERHMARVSKKKNITHEDLVGAPDNVLPDVATYFGRRPAKKANYQIAPRGNEKHKTFAAHYTKQLIDRLGLKVSEQGSFVSSSHDLMKKSG